MRPDHYRQLPNGVRCRCLSLWQETDGTFWCCNLGKIKPTNPQGKTNTMTKAFAVVSFGQIEVPTVSATRRAAIVNWLVAGPPRRFVHHGMTDDESERLWRDCRGSHSDHEVIEVEIRPLAFSQP